MRVAACRQGVALGICARLGAGRQAGPRGRARRRRRRDPALVVVARQPSALAARPTWMAAAVEHQRPLAHGEGRK